jgi:pimeloyl-ACP methyl ester carboxylesterase
MTLAEIRLHGHDVVYRREGEGPVILLIHGITSGSATWERAIRRLARDHTVIAPDLLGHGASAKPRGDYSLGSFAAGLRDLLLALDIESATVVGHSLGGGIAMQLAYQFPERVDRLVLVSSGGLGREVNFVLRASSLPGSEVVLPLVTARWIAAAGGFVGAALSKVGLQLGADLEGLSKGYASLRDPGSRRAFVHTVRAVIDPVGQRVNAHDRLYLAADTPSLIVWGARDRIIPVRHGEAAHEAMPGSRLEILERGGHFPHNDDPDWFGDVLTSFIAGTEPAAHDTARIRAMLLERST